MNSLTCNELSFCRINKRPHAYRPGSQVYKFMNVRVPQISGVRDEGRPLAIGLQEQVANHRKRLESKVPVVSVTGKGIIRCQV